MCCLIVLLGLGLPRVTILLAWLLNPSFIEAPFANVLVPIFGFVFLPFTTLSYAWAYTFPGGPWSGGGVIIILIAVLLDLGTYGGGATSRNKPRATR